jgi:hypothetical protein
MGNMIPKRVRKGIARHDHEIARIAKKLLAKEHPVKAEVKGKK